MGDFSLEWGGDLDISPSGDFAIATGDVLSRQRVIRRLCTNPRVVLNDGSVLDPDYWLKPTFGAGLGRQIGASISVSTRASLDAIELAIRTSLRGEPTVSQAQPPQIQLAVAPDGVLVTLSYTSASTGNQVAVPTLLVQP